MTQPIYVLIENTRLSGGYLEVQSLLAELSVFEKVALVLTPRPVRSVRNFVAYMRDLVIAKWQYLGKRGISVVSSRKFVNSSAASTVITTAKGTLLYFGGASSNRHIHYCQHIELWDLYRSDQFRELTEDEGYPGPEELVNAIVNQDGILTATDIEYIEKLKGVRNFLVPSLFLKKTLQLLTACEPDNIQVRTPKPHIPVALNARQPAFEQRDYDFVFWIRGNPFKDDETSVVLARHCLESGYKVSVLVSRGSMSQTIRSWVQQLRDLGGHIVEGPSDLEVAKTLMASRFAVHTSLVEGFGSFPQEAAACGCGVISSKVGFLCCLEKTLCGKALPVQVIEQRKHGDFKQVINGAMNGQSPEKSYFISVF